MSLALGLLQDGLLEDDAHNVFIVQVFLAQLQLIKQFLPLWGHIFSIERAVCEIKGNGSIFFNRQNLGLMLLLLFMFIP